MVPVTCIGLTLFQQALPDKCHIRNIECSRLEATLDRSFDPDREDLCIGLTELPVVALNSSGTSGYVILY
jgi:hypothetical protein